jgi:hypothetical protein
MMGGIELCTTRRNSRKLEDGKQRMMGGIVIIYEHEGQRDSKKNEQ